MRGTLVVCCLLVGCSAEAPATGDRANAAQEPACVTGQARACTCASGGTGTQQCDAQWSECACVGGTAGTSGGGDFGNSQVPVAPSPTTGDGGVPSRTGNANCSPGFYLGTYECQVTLFGFPFPLTGDVSFNLSVNESVVTAPCEASDEFCADLVISENGGTLFGLAGFTGFETQLDGALDCATGEFRAMGVDGRYGPAVSTDPNDPNALWTVQDPPLGMFAGELEGTHSGASGGAIEAIEGTWHLFETVNNITCDGPFRVELQP